MNDIAPKSPVRDFWISNLWVDLLVAAALLSAHIGLILAWAPADVFGNALPADRRGVYSSAAIVVSLLGSFSAVAIGQLGTAKGARTTALKRQAGQLLARNWRAVFRTAMIAAFVAVLALLLDPSVPAPNPVHVAVRFTFEFAMLLAIVRFGRLSALFFEVMNLSAKESGEQEEPLAAPPVAHPGWNKTAG